MTQISRPQQGRQSTYPDAGGYTANQWARLLRLLARDYTTEGPFYAYLDGLEVTNPAGVTIRVAKGAGLVNGHLLLNEDQTDPEGSDSNVDFTPSTPGANRIDVVVMVQNNTDSAYDGTADYGSAVLEFPTDLTDYESTASVPAHSARLAILTGVEGGAARSLTFDAEVDGDIQMVELARYTITSAPAISGSITDNRDFVDAETKTFFIPATGAYNTTDGTVVNYDGDNNLGFPTPDNKVTRVVGYGVFPEDYISGGEISVVARPAAAGDAYLQTVAHYSQLDGTAIDSDTAAVAAITFGALETTGYSAKQPLTVTTTPSTYNGIGMVTERRANDVLDTINDILRISGWQVEYLGYRR